MARKRKIGLFDLGRLPVTKIEYQGRPSLKKFQEQYDREQQEIAEAPIKKLEAEFNQGLRELREIQRETLFAKPSDELASRCTLKPDFIEGTAEVISGRVLAAARVGTQGVTLTKSGRDKLVSIMQVNPIDSTNPENWKAALAYAIDLGVMTPEDGISAPTPIPQVGASHAPSLDELLRNTSAESRTGREILVKAVGREWSASVCDFFFLWCSSLKKNFNYDFPVDELAKKVGDYLVKWHLDPLAHKSYDQVRRAFVALGYFPDTMLTNSERLEILIEAAPNLSDRSTRMDIAQRTREITEQQTR